MEKNGAISNNTPCCGGGCSKMSKEGSEADARARQQMLFPDVKELADKIDNDLTKQAIEAVVDESTKSNS